MKLKTLLIAILVFLCWSLFIYLCNSFLLMELNPMKWTWSGRLVQVGFGFVMGIILASYVTYEDR